MKEILYRLLEHALEDFYAQEQRNLQLNVHEICHGHRLAIYFENRIREYDNTHREKLFENYHGNRKCVVIYIDVDQKECMKRMRIK